MKTSAKTLKALQRAVAIVGSQNALAKALTEATGHRVYQSHVYKWLNGRRLPAEWCIPIERVTNCMVTRYELRPDIYPEVTDHVTCNEATQSGRSSSARPQREGGTE
jgi:DNA-binding transcriptional regulator YdaS (Cro superfamily)